MPSNTPLARLPLSSLPWSRKSMSISQTYHLAQAARGKLAHEASQPDHCLARLVGHANLLDSLMLELSHAEHEEPRLCSEPPRQLSSKPDDSRHVQWADCIVEDPEEDWQASDADSSDSDSDYDSEEDDVALEADVISLQRIIPTPFSRPAPNYVEHGLESVAAHQLQESVPSHRQPPELDHDSDSSEDENMPPTPPASTLPGFFEKPYNSDLYDVVGSAKDSAIIPPSEQHEFFEKGFYLPRRGEQDLISTVSVY
ncbi:unnamed protein product [Blumeria hordei]|uniref:Uncharacterized protein n=1 Tax=Blumeria hordei TaxID=2867405 RepID=A0A383UWT0_BLUHO|nr:unnamed protein product [Blumeria hordei]